MAHGFEHTPHFAVAAFGNGDLVPAVGAFAATVFDGTELGHAVVQPNAVQQTLLFDITQRTQHTHRIFTL